MDVDGREEQHQVLLVAEALHMEHLLVQLLIVTEEFAERAAVADNTLVVEEY